MIQLSHINKIYTSDAGKVVALKNINLQVQPGEIFGVIGPSGAGKSTLIRCVNLLERPTSGTVTVAGQELTRLPEPELRKARGKIGMIFQHFNLLASRTAYDNIALPLELVGQSKTEIARTITPLLELTGLTDKKDYYPSQLSGGQKQRVAIARALANQPKVLLCDEATSALDPYTTQTILQLLKDINQKLGLTILLITHVMDVIKTICHDLAILQDGEIIEQADVIAFFARPQTMLAKSFVRTALQDHLPEKLQKRILAERTSDSNPLLQISFIGQVASEPLIAQLIQQFAITLNIWQANIEHIRDAMVGIMLVEASGDIQQIHDGIAYLTKKGVLVEVIGYVKRNT
ncbi:MAG: methionine ABC transporter ATP-binding protein [Gammaproteobacteria bacterium]